MDAGVRNLLKPGLLIVCLALAAALPRIAKGRPAAASLRRKGLRMRAGLLRFVCCLAAGFSLALAVAVPAEGGHAVLPVAVIELEVPI